MLSSRVQSHVAALKADLDEDSDYNTDTETDTDAPTADAHDATEQPWRICGSVCTICSMPPEADLSIVPWRCTARCTTLHGFAEQAGSSGHRVAQVRMRLQHIGRPWPDGVVAKRVLKNILHQMAGPNPSYAYCANRRGGWKARTRLDAGGDANIHAVRNVSGMLV